MKKSCTLLWYFFMATFIPRKIREFLFKYYNRFLFFLAGVDYGKHLDVYTGMTLKKYKGAEVSIGDDFYFSSGSSINPICRNIKGCIFVNNNAKLHIGNDVGISSACIWCDESIEIGNHVRIGGDCLILDTDRHSLDYMARRTKATDIKQSKTKPVVIGDDVLIGARSIILKGVHIGARTVIGAGSVVSQDIPKDSIAAGNPCKVIRSIDRDESLTN